MTYDKFSKYYDLAMGDRSKMLDTIKSLIKKYLPKANNVLELACGTGAIMTGLAEEYKVVDGLELSPRMISLAKKKLPNSHFYQASMENFSVPGTYDVILCPYDSINHLDNFNAWSNVFKSVTNHLSTGGVFIFDINTVNTLNKISTGNWSFRPFNRGYCAISISKNMGDHSYKWEILVFDRKDNDNYEMMSESINEVSFPIAKIKKDLSKHFSKVICTGLGNRINKAGTRVFFICHK